MVLIKTMLAMQCIVLLVQPYSRCILLPLNMPNNIVVAVHMNWLEHLRVHVYCTCG